MDDYSGPVPSMEMLWQKVQGCRVGCAAIAQEMKGTAAAFKKTFRMPCPVYLSVQKLNSAPVYLRWRQTGVRVETALPIGGKTNGHLTVEANVHHGEEGLLPLPPSSPLPQYPASPAPGGTPPLVFLLPAATGVGAA